MMYESIIQLKYTHGGTMARYIQVRGNSVVVVTQRFAPVLSFTTTPYSVVL